MAVLKGLFEKRAGGGEGDLEKAASVRSTPVGGGHSRYLGQDETVTSDYHGDWSMRGSVTSVSGH